MLKEHKHRENRELNPNITGDLSTSGGIGFRYANHYIGQTHLTDQNIQIVPE